MSDLLKDLIRRECFDEAIRLLTPDQRRIALLRLELLTDCEIADLLGIGRPLVGRLMRQAIRTISRRVPELAVFLRDRNRAEYIRSDTARALEQGWICDDSAALAELPLPRLFTTAGAARRLGCAASTVRAWCIKGKLPGAWYDGHRWWIPEPALPAAPQDPEGLDDP